MASINIDKLIAYVLNNAINSIWRSPSSNISNRFQCNSYLQFWHSVIKSSIKQCKLCIENTTSKNGIKRIVFHLLQLVLPQNKQH